MSVGAAKPVSCNSLERITAVMARALEQLFRSPPDGCIKALPPMPTDQSDTAFRPPRPAPIPEEGRLDHLDTLRGFALFGILLVNFEFFTRPILATMLGRERLTGADQVVDLSIATLAEGKFYALFSVLFGVGFTLMRERMLMVGHPVSGLYARRLLVLAMFGLAHGTLIWAGDILLLYALGGALMLAFFRETSPARKFSWAVFLILVTIPLIWASLLTLADAGHVQEMETDHQALQQRIVAAEAVYATGSWRDVTAQTARDFGYLLANGVIGVAPVLGFFLLGTWLFETGRLRNPQLYHAFFERWMFIGLIGGGVLSLSAAWLLQGIRYTVPSASLAQGFTLMTVGAPLLMLGYLSTVIRFRAQLQWLAPAGRMALTNYLLQSVVWTLVFYGYGLGCWGDIPRAWHPLPVVAFFALQVVFSKWWLARFRYGPVEWLWRTLTYLQAQPMVRRS